jgi:hypothetical protein
MFSCDYCFQQFAQQYELFQHSQTSVICFQYRNLRENQCICSEVFQSTYDLNVHRQTCKTIEVQHLRYRVEEMNAEHVAHIERLTTMYESKIAELLQMLTGAKKKDKDFGLVVDFDRGCVLTNIANLTIEDIFINKFEEVIYKILTKNNELMYKCMNDPTNMFVYKENNVVVKDKNMVKLHALIYSPFLQRIVSLLPAYIQQCRLNEDIDTMYGLQTKFKGLIGTSAKMVKTFKAYLIN